jgi:hypothetical protein
MWRAIAKAALTFSNRRLVVGKNTGRSEFTTSATSCSQPEILGNPPIVSAMGGGGVLRNEEII